MVVSVLVQRRGKGGEREQRVIARSFDRLCETGLRFSLERAGDPGRAELERFISERFQVVHDARVEGFLPLLLGVWCAAGCRAALGIRPASNGPLFLEQYLDLPAEQVVAGLCQAPVSRVMLVEIGNLVSAPGAATPLLYLLLLALLDRAGYRWLMFSATPEVERGIRALGFGLVAVCAADPRRVADSSCWGSYYDNRPQVMLGRVEEGMRVCSSDARLGTVLHRIEAVVAELATRLGSA